MPLCMATTTNVPSYVFRQYCYTLLITQYYSFPLFVCFQCPSTNDKDEADLGTSPFGVQLKSRGSTKLTNATPTPKKTPGDSSPEFSKLKLNKTVSSEKQTKTESNKSQGFGVTLKVNNSTCSCM